MNCDHSTFNRVLVEGDWQPDGRQFPRCADCGHRTAYAGTKPAATRWLVLRHPSYLFAELAGRRAARQMASRPSNL